MINTHTAMSWGQELAPVEMQNIKGGDWFTVGLVGALLDFIYNFVNDGGDFGAAASQTGADMSALVNFIKNMISELNQL